MTHTNTAALRVLNEHYFRSYPDEAARRLDRLTGLDAAGPLQRLPIDVVVPVWERLPGDATERLLPHLPEDTLRELFARANPLRSVELLNRLDEATRIHYLSALDPTTAQTLRSIMSYPEDSAGHLMDPRVVPLHGDMTVRDALKRLRVARGHLSRYAFVVDDQNQLTQRVELAELALAEGHQRITELARPVPTLVRVTTPRDEVIATLEQHRLMDLPVVDVHGRLLGIVHHDSIWDALEEETSGDIQARFGASRVERALSKPLFAVRKRQAWLQINLVTAFIAASVVGIFESTIAQFTALAVLLPVVAGQSGNAGAQALAVTMRGLALREITTSHLFQVAAKEVQAGFLNGLAIALTTAIAVFAWSGSFGLSLEIVIAMVASMVAAGFAGATIPMVLVKLGQDPAQSSSIILTTITDVVGFLSFLGTATLLMALL